ncbi:MAG TPA: ABC transporter ATP-binding protein [Porphyromonadaceae bacterium]|jgi:putative ABC transport system permease protein|uniref:ABC transporter permease n=1 Tax=Limibacterium fermenti TaxID=3229863 RepID=UPI000E8D0EBA|nr:ABC transporter ATP-binding protein [Porphyromonadaceae bacterium]HBX20001.1 ABC transporter ATP-binding protein [Porphyromonadaceae bacterium]HBX45634.1 ABC transporter ATP-binding protein [Porphyromonadaceae bacterium]HCM22254.1 ABC transporter ATP-binding protein [Porphyromonadaceae bacterium]
MKNFFDIDRWQEIWITITHNKSRSFLTAFGVFWGILMLVVMVGAGNALQTGIFSQIDGFATNSCYFTPEETSLPYRGFRKGRRWEIKNADIPIIRQRVKDIDQLSPLVYMWPNEENVVRGEYKGSYTLRGCYPENDNIDRSIMLKGRFINEIDIADKRKVCILGERVYEVLFPKGEDPIGSVIRANGIYFQVIGVSKSSSGIGIGGDPKETITIPFSTMQQAFNLGNAIHIVGVTAKPKVKVTQIEKEVGTVLKDLHQIHPDDPTAVWAINLEEQFNMFNYLGIGIAALIWIVGLGTLFAGAIGVSNIMLVTVRERTKEIGIRRALGATPNNIIGQILSESIVLTLLAGVLGVVLGVGILGAAGIVLSHGDQFFKDPQIHFSMAVGAVLILGVIGALAGFLPAQRAMMIKPIEAIREE